VSVSDSQQTDSHSVVPQLPQLLVLLLLLFPPPTMVKLCPIHPYSTDTAPCSRMPHCSIEALVGVEALVASRHRGIEAAYMLTEGVIAIFASRLHRGIEGSIESDVESDVESASSLTSSLRRVCVESASSLRRV
jgi:hypothetical protein